MKDRFDPVRLRKLYPGLSSSPETVYLDSASTVQVSQPVLDAVAAFHSSGYANPGRGSYPWAHKTLQTVAQARERIARTIGGDAEGLIFTSGSTQSLNLVALAWGAANLQDGDEILLNPGEHSSQVKPWYALQEAMAKGGTRIEISEFRYHPVGDYDVDHLVSLITPRTRLVSVSQVHNVFGMEMGIGEIRAALPERVLLSVDGSQSVGHMRVHARSMGADFLSFSGHKMGALTGIGGLWVSERARNAIVAPYVGSRSLGRSGSARLQSLETGTPNLAGIISMEAACAYVESLGLEAIHAHLSDLTLIAIERLSQVQGIAFTPGPAYSRCAEGWGVLSFNLEGVDPHDLGFALAEQGICVRAGDHCSAGKYSRDSVRISFYAYTLREEIEHLYAALLKLR